MFQNTESNWFEAVVISGDQTGRQIGVQTINLDPTTLDPLTLTGIYASRINIDGILYHGALYFGRRLVKQEKNLVLEIHIFNFNQDVYGKTVLFTLDHYIRPEMDFESLEDLKVQIDDDITKITQYFSSTTDQEMTEM